MLLRDLPTAGLFPRFSFRHVPPLEIREGHQQIIGRNTRPDLVEEWVLHQRGDSPLREADLGRVKKGPTVGRQKNLQ